ncbi:dTDP-4-dehydrorhamnose reductase [Oleiagrimonas soli]|uniref:dTDP-4-dehydrorhamnose reductase n=1 Tax=Oleiagrimonas soli TaxID=1543381 RepID=A0A099CY17_9GAMM|nr:dTDP-4-dehydrorhamnose reductase [Oleiagrimonas soli]KGI78487.1 dTDP-4-dehydrorhamnose reductase [Oleiagrimonas soli]MBB6184263.1 dTDP-4-dehydrorhamnose reductase [Oleiagrimonas soli]
MKMLITGARGQVGRALLHSLAIHGEVVAATRDGSVDNVTLPTTALDLGRPAALADILTRIDPDVIINAAAYTAVDRAESEPELAHCVNAEAVGALGRWAADAGVPVVHYSTDYVFPGQGDCPLRESDPTGPRSVYGHSKLAGEAALRESDADHLILRTAWVYDAQGKNFLRTMLRLGAERDRLTVVDDQHGTPTSANLIATATAHVLQHWLAADTATRHAQSGVYHLVAGGRTTWCGFARAIMDRAVQVGLLARAPQVEPITTTDFPTPARRPAWSVLDTTRIRETFDIELPAWEVGLDAVIAELTGAR